MPTSRPIAVSLSGDRRKAAELLKRMFPMKTPEQVARAAGVFDGMQAEVAAAGDSLMVTGWTPDHRSHVHRIFHRLQDEAGNDHIVLEHASQSVAKELQGQGHERFADQLRHLDKLGNVKSIHIPSAMGAKDSDFTGYYVWPRYGYDAPIASHHLDRIPAELRSRMEGPPTYHTLFATKGGPEYWKENGGGIKDMQFDLSPDSEHRKRFQSYYENRNRRTDGGVRPTQSPTPATASAPATGSEGVGGEAGTTAERVRFHRQLNDALKYAADRLSCLLIRIDGELRQRVKNLSKSIPADLLIEAEDDPHITVLYGIEEGQERFTKDLLRMWGRPIPFRLGSVSVFESADYDVVKVDVFSPPLHFLHHFLKSHLKVTDTFPTFIPHCTVAYVKKGEGRRIAAVIGSVNEAGIADEVIFSDAERNHSVVGLAKAAVKYKQEDNTLSAAFNSEFGKLADRIHSNGEVSDLEQFKGADHYGEALRTLKGDDQATDALTDMLYGGSFEKAHRAGRPLLPLFRATLKLNRLRNRPKKSTKTLSEEPAAKAEVEAPTPPAVPTEVNDLIDAHTDKFLNFLKGKPEGVTLIDLKKALLDGRKLGRIADNRSVIESLIRKTGAKIEPFFVGDKGGHGWKVYHPDYDPEPDPRVKSYSELEKAKRTATNKELGEKEGVSQDAIRLRLMTLRKIREYKAMMGQPAKYATDVDTEATQVRLSPKAAKVMQWLRRRQMENASTPQATATPTPPTQPQPLNNPQLPQNRVDQDLKTFRQQVRSKIALTGPQQRSPEEYALLTDHAIQRGLKLKPTTGDHYYDEDSHTLYHPTPEDKAAVGEAYAKEGKGYVKFAADGEVVRYETEPTPTAPHPLVHGFHLAHALQSIIDHPQSTPDAKKLAAQTLYHGDPTALYGLNDELIDTNHPILNAGYNFPNAARALHLDQATNEAINILGRRAYSHMASSGGPSPNPAVDRRKATYGTRGMALTWLESALAGKSKDGPASEVIDILRKAGHTDDQLAASLARHRTRDTLQMGLDRNVVSGNDAYDRSTQPAHPADNDPDRYPYAAEEKPETLPYPTASFAKLPVNRSRLMAAIALVKARRNAKGFDGNYDYDPLPVWSPNRPVAKPVNPQPKQFQWEEGLEPPTPEATKGFDGNYDYDPLPMKTEKPPLNKPVVTKPSLRVPYPAGVRPKRAVGASNMNLINTPIKELRTIDPTFLSEVPESVKRMDSGYNRVKINELPEKYVQSPALSDFIAAVRQLRSSNQEVRRSVTEQQFKRLKLDVQSLIDAVADAPHTASAGTGVAVQHNGDRERVTAAAALLGLQMQYPSLLVFHQHDNGSDVLAKFDVAGSAEKLRRRLDSAGLVNRTLVPTEQGWSAIFFDRGGDMLPLIQKAAAAEGSPLQVSYGTGELLGSGEEAEASKSDRKSYRSLIRQWERKQNAGLQQNNPNSVGASPYSNSGPAAPTGAANAAAAPVATTGFTGRPAGSTIGNGP